MTATIDVAYGRVTCGGQILDLHALLEDIDNAERRAAAREALTELVAQAGHVDSVLVPTVWGQVRTAALLAEFAVAGVTPTPIPRAVAIAAAHAEATVQRCVVVETSLLPTTGGHWSVHEVIRRDGQWMLGAGEVTMPQRVPVDPVWARYVEAADAVFVDGGNPEAVRHAQHVLAESYGVKPMPVERDVLMLHGSRTGVVTGADLLAGLPLPPTAPPRRGTRIAGLVAISLVAAVATTAAWVHWPRERPPDRLTVQVGQAELTVPGQWRRTEQGSGGQRVVFVAPDDGRRLIVVVSKLRSGSTPASVATSLRNRISQRGDDAVAEFTTDLSYAGKRVIGYRETPASGAPVSWYVTVSDPVQVSIGCQAGTGEASVDEPCRSAVGSLQVVPS